MKNVKNAFDDKDSNRLLRFFFRVTQNQLRQE